MTLQDKEQYIDSSKKFPRFTREQAHEERELVARAKSGDESAMGIIYDKYINQVYRYVLSRLGNVHNAEDTSMDIFLKVTTGIADYSYRGAPLGAWIMRVARNEVINNARRQRRVREEDISEYIVDPTDSVEDQIEYRSEIEQLVGAVKNLTDSQRDVIVARFGLDLKTNEAASLLRKTTTTVKVTQHHAVQKLKKDLSPENEGKDKRVTEILNDILELIREGDMPTEEIAWLLDVPKKYIYDGVAILRTRGINIRFRGGRYVLPKKE